jgi:anti-sigma B factor antagonist
MLLDDGDLAFRKRIHDLIDRGFAKIVLDLGGVTYIDSSGVGMIVAKLKTLKENGGDMKLLHLNRRAENLLGMLKLLIVFETFLSQRRAGSANGSAVNFGRTAGPSSGLSPGRPRWHPTISRTS